MRSFQKIRRFGQFFLVGCLIVGSCSLVGCGAFSKSKKSQSDIYSPKPAYAKYKKDKKKSEGKPSESVDEFLACKRVPW